MRFGADDYFEASAERFEEANAAYRRGDHFTAHLASGLAIECMLRAYTVRVAPDFDARHNLLLLSDPFLRRVASRHRDEVKVALDEASTLWRNNHRYCSARNLCAFYNRIGRYAKTKQMLRANAENMIGHADVIMRNGVQRWQTP